MAIGSGARLTRSAGRSGLVERLRKPEARPEGMSAFSLPRGRNRPLINILLSPDRWASDFGTLVLPAMIDL